MADVDLNFSTQMLEEKRRKVAEHEAALAKDIEARKQASAEQAEQAAKAQQEATEKKAAAERAAAEAKKAQSIATGQGTSWLG